MNVMSMIRENAQDKLLPAVSLCAFRSFDFIKTLHSFIVSLLLFPCQYLFYYKHVY